MRDDEKLVVAGVVASTFILAATTIVQHVRNQNMLLEMSVVAAHHEHERKKRLSRKGRYCRRGALHTPLDSFWYKVRLKGDDMEFLHFTAFTRESF